MKFQIRDYQPGDFFHNPPGGRVLVITRELSPSHTEHATFPLTPEDIAAFNSIAFQVNCHEPLPIEAGTP